MSKASEDDILGELDVLSDRISTQVRTTAVGALALSWGILIGESSVAKTSTSHLKWHLVGVCAVAVLTLFLDFAQYLAGYWNTLAVYRVAERRKDHKAAFDENSFYFRLRSFFFSAKVVALSVTVFWLLGALVSWLATS
jgi:hypothetical protein